MWSDRSIPFPHGRRSAGAVPALFRIPAAHAGKFPTAGETAVRLLCLACCFLVIGLSLAEAQDATEAQKRPGLSITGPLTFVGGREHLRFADSKPISDHFWSLSPGTFSWVGLRPRLEVSLHYRPEFELFRNHRELNAWNHTADFRLTSRVTQRLTFDAGDRFLAALVLPRGRFRDNSAYAGLRYTWSPRTTLGLRLDNSITEFALPKGSRRGLFDLFDTAGTASLSRGTASVSRFFTPRQKLGFGYSYARFNLPWRVTEAPDGSLSSGPVHHVSVEYGYNNERGLLLEFSGGGIVQGDGLFHQFSGRLEKRWGEFSIAVGYQRGLSLFGFGAPGLGAGGVIPDFGLSNGLLPSVMYEAGMLELSAPVTRRLGVGFATLAARTDSGRGEREVRGLLGRARLSYRVAERWAIFAGGELQSQNLSAFAGIPVARRRYFGGLEFYLSSAANPPRLTHHEPGSTDPSPERKK